MTHRTKEYWAEFDMEHMLKNDLWIALKDLAELFARVEALEASLASAVKVAEEERGHTSRVLTRNAELEAENAALKAQVAEWEWRPIESAPRNGTPVLMYFPKRYQGKGGISWAVFAHDEWVDSRAFRDPDGTHWMPLPAHPNTTLTKGPDNG